MTKIDIDFDALHTDLWIDGAWREGAGKSRFDVLNPATEEVLASVASAEIEDANTALDAAETAMKDWAARTPRQRSEVLRKAWELLTDRLEDIARLITLENGKARADAMGEAAYAAEFFRWFAEEAVRADGLVTHAPASGARILVQHKPAGLAVLVTPWNYQAAMGTRKISPALAAVCGVVIKTKNSLPNALINNNMENKIPRQLAHIPIQRVFITAECDGRNAGSTIRLPKRVYL